MRNTITSSIRQGIRDAISALAPIFHWPGVKTLVPTTGTTPTFTRATTKTGTNFDGQVFAGLANEPIFEGARRVENLLTASEDMTNAAYADALGAVSAATTTVFDGTTNGQVYQNVTITDDGSGASGRTFVFSVDIALVSGSLTNVTVAIEGNAITNSETAITGSITTTAQRFSHTAVTDAAGTVVTPLVYCDDAATLSITNWQVEEVTGQANQNPSEYVSTGVGTGSELITNGDFATDTDWTDYLGGTVGGTIVITGGELVVTQGSNSVWMGAYQTFSTVIGKQYLMSGSMTARPAGGSARLGAHNGSNPSAAPDLGYVTMTAVGDYSLVFTATGTTTTVVISNGGAATVTQSFDNLSIKEASHGANIDGVQYFLQTNTNTVNGGVVTSTNKAMTFTEERTGPIALSTPLAVDDGFNASTSLHGSVASFPNLLPPAARNRFEDEWTQTGDGRVTPIGDGTRLYTSANALNPDNETDATTGFSVAAGALVTSQSDITSSSGFALKMESNTAPTPSARVYQEIGAAFGLVAGGDYVIEMDIRHVGTGGTWRPFLNAQGDSGGTPQYLPAITNTQTEFEHISYRFTYLASENDWLIFSEVSGTNDGGLYVDNLDIQLYSDVTTLSDEDDTAGEAIWGYSLTIPNDDETYSASVILSEGTATATDIRIQYKDVSTQTIRYKYTWATGVLSQITDQGAGTTVSASVNSDGTVTVTVQTADDASNTTVELGILPAGNDASAQGTVNVHGDVVLNRVSAAAEPTWNTLRPGDSVEQHVLQQNDPNTTWTDVGATVVSGLSDPAGGTDAFSLQDDNSGASEYMFQANLDLSATAGDIVRAGMWIKKTSSADDYPSVLLYDSDAAGGVEVVIDDYLGKIIDGGPTPDSFFIVDGATIKALMPDRFPDGDQWWYLELTKVAISTDNYQLYLQPGNATAWDGTTTGVAEHLATYYAPSVWIGDSFFFDSLATTATVTEVIQDWSKIFSYSTEASNNVASIVFDHNYLEGAGVNIEGARTNLATRSSTFTSWTAAGGGAGSTPVVTANYAKAPDGTLTASRLVSELNGGTASGDYSWIKANSITGLANPHDSTGSIWVKSNTGASQSFTFYHAGGAGQSVHTAPSQWTRIDNFVVCTATTDQITIGLRGGATGGNDSLDILIWGAQLEVAAFPSSYIPTEASSVTRNADLLTSSAVGVADTFPMTAYAEYIQSEDQSSGATTSYVFSVNENATPNQDEFYIRTRQPQTDYQGVVYSGASLQANINGGTTAAGVLKTLTLAVALNDVEMYVDGVSVGSDTSAALPATPALISVGSQAGGGTPAYGNIRNVKIFDKRLTDAEVSKL